MSFQKTHFKRLLWLLQSEEKPTRYAAFDTVKNEIGAALRAVHFDYTQMMMLCKALWLLLYKEDITVEQSRISVEIS